MWLKNKFNKIYSFLKTKLMADYVESSFLLPVKESAEIGNGQLHPACRWKEFENKLLEEFFGYTVASEVYDGCWKENDVSKPEYDTLRKYYVAVRPKDLNILKKLLKEATETFRQKSIYFACGGRVEFINHD